MRILATLLGLDGGAVSVNGFDVVANPAQVRRSISLTGQFAAVDEILTAGRTLAWCIGILLGAFAGATTTYRHRIS